MSVKGKIKQIASPFWCIWYGFPNLPNIYVGRGAKIVHGKQFEFNGAVAFMPYSMTVARTSNSRLCLGENV